MRILNASCVVLALAAAGCGANGKGDPSTKTALTTSAPVVGAQPSPAPVEAPPRDAAPASAGVESAPPLAAADPISAVAPRPEYREVTLPAGTRLSVALGSTVSSRTSVVENNVNGTLRSPIVVNGQTIVPAGAGLGGYVTEARRSARVKGRARVGFRFTSLRVNGERHEIESAAIAREARGTKKSDAVKIGVGTGAGALVGALTGGKKGAAIGTAVGAAGGTGVVLATRGEEVTLPAGTVVTTRLTAPLTVRLRMP
jgi:hypothetical protein